jgi:hypothetical protein
MYLTMLLDAWHAACPTITGRASDDARFDLPRSGIV